MAVSERPSPERLREIYERTIGKCRDLYQSLNTFMWTDCTRSELGACYSLDTSPLRKVPKDIEEQLNASDVDCTRSLFRGVRSKGSSEYFE